MDTRFLSLSLITLVGAATLVGCGPTPVSPPTPTSTVAITGVNACNVFTPADLSAAFPGSAPSSTSNGTPRAGFSIADDMFSNCHWDLMPGLYFELHLETYADRQGAKNIVVSNLSDDRQQGGAYYQFQMEPSLGAEAYYRIDHSSVKLSVPKGNSFYDLYLKSTGNLDASATEVTLKQLVERIR